MEENKMEDKTQNQEVIILLLVVIIIALLVILLLILNNRKEEQQTTTKSITQTKETVNQKGTVDQENWPPCTGCHYNPEDNSSGSDYNQTNEPSNTTSSVKTLESITKTFDNGIIGILFATNEYFKDAPIYHKYHIDSEEELKAFYKIYSNKLNLDTKYFDNYEVFINVREKGPGEGSLYDPFVSVDYDNTIRVTSASETFTGKTTERYFYYLVGIIPKKLLINVDIDEWVKPSKVLKKKENYNNLKDYTFTINSENKFTIVTDEKQKGTIGSYTDIYYQIDLDRNIVIKVEETYRQINSGYPTTPAPYRKRSEAYRKVIDETIAGKVKKVIDKYKNYNSSSNTGTYILLRV